MSRLLVRYHCLNADMLMLQVCDCLAALCRDALTRTAGSLEGLDGTPKPRDDQVYDALVSLSAGVPLVRDKLATQYGLLGHVLGHEFAVQYPELAGQPAEELSYLFVALM